ncbi:MAG TPA: hypothetical protein VEZ88_10245 [Steroidobacteraceae bacterium]|nr:hypothetical protein [Steroidobacteraceae bacterium]
MSAEHVYLESDVSEVPDPRAVRNIQTSLKLHGRWRGCFTVLDIFEKRFLAVRLKRPHTPVMNYAIDLRFIDPIPQRSRHIPWRCLQATAAFALLAVALSWWIRRSPLPLPENGWLAAWVLILSAALCAGLLSAYRMSETLTFFSVHGRARLFDVVGGLGVFRAAHQFEAELAVYINKATQTRGRARGQLLRDEMREHYRLQQHGILTMSEYEASRARILQQHD